MDKPTLDQQDIKTLANLAKLEIAEENIDEVTQSISDVLNLVNELQAADFKEISPMAHPLDAVQRLRADVVTEDDVRDQFQAIAPATEAGLYLVPKVID